nr:mucin-16-like [Desmodus rotundus]
MGWEGPAYPLPHQPGHLMALVVSLLLTCGPGAPWNAGVSAQSSDQVTSGATRQSRHSSSFPGSLATSVGLPGSAAPTPSLSPGGGGVETTLELDSGPTGARLPQDASVGVTPVKETVAPLTSLVKTTAAPWGQGRTSQSPEMTSSALADSTSRETANSEQRTSPSLSPQANRTPSGNSPTKSIVQGFSSVRTGLRTSSTQAAFAREASTGTHAAETASGQAPNEYNSPSDIPAKTDNRAENSWGTKHLPTAVPASTETNTDWTVSQTKVPTPSTSSETTTTDAPAPGNMSPLSRAVSSSLLDTSPPGAPQSWGASSQDPTPLDTRRALSSPGTSSAGHTTRGTGTPPQSPASAPTDKVSGSSTLSVQRVTSSTTTATPETTGGTEPSSAVPLSMTLSSAATGAGRVTSTTAPPARPSPSGGGMAGSIHTLSTSSETRGTPSIPAARTLASEWSGGPGTPSITSMSGVKATSPSTTSGSQESHTLLSITAKGTRESSRASVSAPEASSPGRESNMATDSGPTQGFTIADSRLASEPQPPSSHPVREGRTSHGTSAGLGTGTAAPEGSAPPRTPLATTTTRVPWTTTHTAQHPTKSLHTPGTDASPGMTTSLSVAAPVTTSLVTLVISGSTTPRTSSTEITSPRETSADTRSTEATTGPATVSTNVKASRGYDSERRLGTTHLPDGATPPPEPSTDFTLAGGRRVPLSVPPPQSVGAAGSTPPETGSQPTGTFSEAPYRATPGGTTVSGGGASPPPALRRAAFSAPPEPRSAGSSPLSILSSPPPAPTAEATTSATVSAQSVAAGTTVDTGETSEWDMPNSPSTASSSLANIPTSADGGRSATVSPGTLSPAPSASAERSERRRAVLSPSPESAVTPSISLGARTASERPRHTSLPAASAGPRTPGPSPSVETTTPVSAVKMETDEVSYSSGSQPEIAHISRSADPMASKPSGTQGNSHTIRGHGASQVHVSWRDTLTPRVVGRGSESHGHRELCGDRQCGHSDA